MVGLDAKLDFMATQQVCKVQNFACTVQAGDVQIFACTVRGGADVQMFVCTVGGGVQMCAFYVESLSSPPISISVHLQPYSEE